VPEFNRRVDGKSVPLFLSNVKGTYQRLLLSGKSQLNLDDFPTAEYAENMSFSAFKAAAPTFFRRSFERLRLF
jgi:hypothetical protein